MIELHCRSWSTVFAAVLAPSLMMKEARKFARQQQRTVIEKRQLPAGELAHFGPTEALRLRTRSFGAKSTKNQRRQQQ